MNIIQKMEELALIFMKNRKKIEDRLAKEMREKMEDMKKEIEINVKAQSAISISMIDYFVDSELNPIIEKYIDEQQNIMDSAVRDNFDLGIENGQRLLQISNEEISPYNKDIRDTEYEEVLIALLMYTERLVGVLGADLSNGLKKDLTSIYITGKNIRNREDTEKDIDSNNNTTINTIIGGSIISRYINPTFKNITYRSELIARNETNRALNHGHIMRYLKEGIPYVKWVVVQDERLCHHCRAAGNGGPFGNGVYHASDVATPPLHSRCRCLLIPYRDYWVNIRY